MSKVKFEHISDGRIESERIVRLMTADGIEEEVIVAPEQTEGDYLLLPAIAEERERVLFELPRESSSGRWRLWISREKVGASNDPD